MPDPIRLLSAGSLRHALPPIITAFEDAGGGPVALTLGPAGLLRERIEAGEAFDLFASANMDHPRRLDSLGMTDPPACLARNRLCVLARADLGLTAANFLKVLSDPALRIGTSTPGDDPSGDYAVQMFDLVEAGHPGIGTGMKARARHLVGGRNSSPGRDAAILIASGEADVFIGYITSARSHIGNPALRIVEVPDDWAPRIEYGLVMRKGTSEGAKCLRDYLLSPLAGKLLQEAGFMSTSAD